MAMKHLVLSSFDTKHLRYAFAYGSAVSRQAGYTEASVAGSMLDFMLVVRGDPLAFHQANLQKNPAHYSSVLRAARPLIRPMQESGAGVYFNTDVQIGERRAKYGIVGEDRFISDLQHWDSLYLAGRLHKPVLSLIDMDAALSSAQRQNLIFALHAGLLRVPARFSVPELLEAIVGLSYLGDVRTALAESPAKVRNIVEGQYQQLWALYEPLLAEVGLGTVLQSTGGDQYLQEAGPQVRYLRSLCLPYRIKEPFAREFTDATSDRITQSIASIVRWPSAVQSAKGLITANPAVSLKYLLAKIYKRFL